MSRFLNAWTRVDENNPVRVIDAFVDALALAGTRFRRGRAGADWAACLSSLSALLKLYIYSYLNRVQSSRLEREAGRNVGLMWLLGRLVPDHKMVTDFRKDNGRAIRQVCALSNSAGDDLLVNASVAIDGSKLKAVNNRDQNFTRGEGARAPSAA